MSTPFFINSLHAKGVRLFDSLDVKFNPRFNFLIGPNGTGKTSLLRCLVLCFSTSVIEDSRFGENAEVWLDFQYQGKFFRVGQANPIGSGPWIISPLYRSAQPQYWPRPSAEGVEAAYSSAEIQANFPAFTPLVIGAYRKIDYKRISGMQREEALGPRRQTIRNNAPQSLSGAYIPNVKQWLINRYFIIDKEWAITERQNWEWLVSNMQYLSPKGIDFHFKEIRQDLEPMFLIQGKECYLEELSAGFQSVMSLVFAIFDWLEAINEGEERLAVAATGTVIIDELDAHLHPEWQLSIRETLDKFFPNLQFIATTHSPHLIATAQPGEILVLPNHSGTVNIEPNAVSYGGWNTDQILEEIMGVSNLKTKLYARLLAEVVQSSETKSVSGLESAISSLEKVVHPSDPVVEVLKIRLASLKVLQNG